jgi:hypothetical protein
MSDGVLKQIVFDCAAELLHESEGLTKEQIANRLLNAIKRHDEHNHKD